MEVDKIALGSLVVGVSGFESGVEMTTAPYTALILCAFKPEREVVVLVILPYESRTDATIADTAGNLM